MQLVKELYVVTRNFPTDERFGLTAQMCRSAVSTPSNVAAGHGRHQTRDFIRFLRIATGSMFELQTQLESSRDIECLTSESFNALNSATRELERMLTSLIRKLAPHLTE